ncbi:hypothetical protein X992_5594 [Burkholderia pseudomallei MSHR5492]|nr:hypothetical protein X992_5594 [Burkholderia pseudomallei MSHR5492]
MSRTVTGNPTSPFAPCNARMRICSGRIISAPSSPAVSAGPWPAVATARPFGNMPLMPPLAFAVTLTGRKFELPMKLATKRDVGLAYSSSPVPTCSIAPLLKTAIRSERRSASSWSCVT